MLNANVNINPVSRTLRQWDLRKVIQLDAQTVGRSENPAAPGNRGSHFVGCELTCLGFLALYTRTHTHTHARNIMQLCWPKIIFSFAVFMLHVFHFTGFYVPLHSHLAQVLENTIAWAHTHIRTRLSHFAERKEWSISAFLFSLAFVVLLSRQMLLPLLKRQ